MVLGLKECVPPKRRLSLRVSVRECSRYRTAVNMAEWSTLPDDCTALISSHYRAKLHHRMMMRELSDTIQYYRNHYWIDDYHPRPGLFNGSADDLPRVRRFLFVVRNLDYLLEVDRQHNEIHGDFVRRLQQHYPELVAEFPHRVCYLDFTSLYPAGTGWYL